MSLYYILLYTHLSMTPSRLGLYELPTTNRTVRFILLHYFHRSECQLVKSICIKWNELNWDSHHFQPRSELKFVSLYVEKYSQLSRKKNTRNCRTSLIRQYACKRVHYVCGGPRSIRHLAQRDFSAQYEDRLLILILLLDLSPSLFLIYMYHP